MIRELTRQDALDLVTGAKILANGGGGNEKKAISLINDIYDQNLFFKIGSITDLVKKDKICIIGLVGGGVSEQDKKIIKNLEVKINNPMIFAISLLEVHLRQRIRGFVATELGPLNSIIPLAIAAQMDERIVIDGDCCGRSKPKISISTTAIHDIPISPFTVCSQFGDQIIVKDVVDDNRGEFIARTLARVSNGSIGVARCPMTVDQARFAIIPGTLSKAVILGKMIRKAHFVQENPLKIIQKILPEAKLVCRGKVLSFSRTEEGGFTSGKILVQSSSTDDKLTIFYLNEYLLTWLNGSQYITCPDSIILVDSITGLGLTPWEDDFTQGRDITIYSIDAPEIWTSERGLSIFGPKQFDSSWEKYIPSSKILH